MIRGIDVSRYQTNPDFVQAKQAGFSFVYIKATEGVTYQDPAYQTHAVNANNAGLYFGFYHFARPDNGNQPQDEAQNLLNAISAFNYNLFPVLDLEVSVPMSDTDLYNWAKSFIDTVKAQTGRNVVFYTYLSYLESRPALKQLANDGIPLWIAAYSSEQPVISGWDWAMWQYTDQENVPGIGTCDADKLVHLDLIRITPQWQRYLKLTTPYMTGDDVKLVQQQLYITADGIFGQQTHDAVVKFQENNGLTTDGVVGPVTWSALFNPYTFKRTIKLTSPYTSGDDVSLVQQKLGLTIDGVYGPNTQQAVINFQQSKGLTPDGIVGKNTWNALFQQ